MKDLLIYIIGLFFGILISTLLILYSVEIKNIMQINKNIEEHFKNNDIDNDIDDDTDKQKLNMLSYDDLKIVVL